MSFRLASILLLVIAARIVTAVANNGQCRTSGAHLAVTSSTNQTGHWFTNLRFDRDSRLPRRPAAMLLDVRSTTSRCSGVRTDSLAISLQGPPPPPGLGFEELEGFGYYKLHEEILLWEEAKVSCEAEDAHLLILNSEEEASAIQQLIKRHPKTTEWLHIGFHDKDVEGHYVTLFGDTLDTAGFTRWNPGQPDNLNNEDCGSINAATIGLNDLYCTSVHKFSFICEQSYI